MNTNPHGVFNYGTAFKNGKLYRFDCGSAIVIRFWPLPAAWVMSEGKDWKAFRPEIDLHAMSHPPVKSQEELDMEACLGDDSETEAPKTRCERAALLTIPEPVRHVVERFPSNWQFPLLSLIGRCDGALDLASSNPALATMLAASRVFRKPEVQNPMRTARLLLRKKRRDICAWLGFPAKDSAARCLAKTAHAALTANALTQLRTVCNNDELLQRLGFIPRLNAEVIEVFSQPNLLRACSNSFLADLGRESHDIPGVRAGESEPQLARILSDVLQMRQGQPLPALTSVAQLIRQHEEGIEELRRRENAVPFVAFRPPPLPGFERIIQPVTNTDDLQAWGDRNRNCCFSYWRRIADLGDIYIYKVTTADGILATLSLTRSHGRKWKLDELKEPCNQHPRREIVELVNRWLQTVQPPEVRRRRLKINDTGPTLFDGLLDEDVCENIPF